MTTPLKTIRRMLLALLAFGLVGTTTELSLMGHYEDWWQMIPLAGMTLALLALLWCSVSWSPSSVLVFRICMLLLMTAGVTGTLLHYRANMEFQLEMDPAIAGWELMSKVLHAKAPPALAPGNMTLLGLLGLISTVGASRD